MVLFNITGNEAMSIFNRYKYHTMHGNYVRAKVCELILKHSK